MVLSPGQIINGKYRVLRLLGDGGMGSVYEAHHEVLGSKVALKMLHAELSRTGVAKRFLQEARASARIKSRHVVGVSDADQTPEGHAFIVLEFLDGKTLREVYEGLAREGKKLPFDDAMELAFQMFEGVEAAHAAGIVHRDLKPDNVMITHDTKGAVVLKVLDFGIAKVDDPADAAPGQPSPSGQALTRAGALLGTPEYMAPEQVYSASSADVRSDVFSLGVILFEMFSGRRPVLSDDPQQIAVSYLTGAFTRLEDICPALSPGLCQAVHHALAAQPRDRFASVAEMRAALEPYAPPGTASTNARLSLAATPAALAATVLPPLTSAPAHRSIPETNTYPAQTGKSGTTVMRSTPPPAAQAVTPHGPPLTENDPGVPSSSGVPTRPADLPRPSPAAFTPEYPAAMAPYSVPPSAPLPATNPPPSVQPASAPAVASWPMPVQPSFTPAPPRRSRKGLWAGIALAFLLVATGVTLGLLYYLGWLDPDPPPTTTPHKPPSTHKPPTHPAPHHTGGGQLR